MADDDEVKYSNMTVTAVRGLEARSISKWEQQGWELVSQTPGTLMRTTLVFRKPKSASQNKKKFIAIGALLVVGFGGLGLAAAIGAGGKTGETAAAPTSSAAMSAVPSAAATHVPAVTPGATSPAGRPVTSTEVVATFRKYFTERASHHILWGKAVTAVTYQHGVVRVVMDAAASGVDPAVFNSVIKPLNMPRFAATPVAFDDDIGNRLRPSIDSIEVVRADGSSLGSISHAGILALNNLSK